MVWTVPTILVGEFHGIEGIRTWLASQFYTFQRHHNATHNSPSSQPSQIVAYSMMDAAHACGVLVGKQASTGFVSATLQATLTTMIGARALATDDKKEDCIVWVDPNVGNIASYTFHLRDVRARGERRKFFVAVTHPHHDGLLQRWPVVYALLQVIAEQWVTSAEGMGDWEYRNNPNLVRHREEAARWLRPLSSLVEMPDKEKPSEIISEAEFLMDFHTKCEVGFVKAFGGLVLRSLLSTAKTMIDAKSSEILPPGKAGNAMMTELKKAMASSTTSSSTTICRDAKCRCVVADSPECKPQVTEKRVVVRPLAAWLRTMLADEVQRARFDTKAGKMLTALLTGNQIIVSSEDEYVATDIALSLAQILPVHLRSVTVRSDAYVPGYSSRIVALSSDFVDRHHIVVDRTYLQDDRDQFVLSETPTAHGAVHVEINDDGESNAATSFVDVKDCVNEEDTESEMSGSSKNPSFARSHHGSAQPNNGVRRAGPLLQPLVHEFPSPVTRILNLVLASEAEVAEDSKQRNFAGWCHEVKLLQSQIELVVAEYIGRGRLYTLQFQAQYRRRNEHLLLLAQSTNSSSNTTAPPKPQSKHERQVADAEHNNGLGGRLKKFFSFGGSAKRRQHHEPVVKIQHSTHLDACVASADASPKLQPQVTPIHSVGYRTSTTSAFHLSVPSGTTSMLSFGRSSQIISDHAVSGHLGAGGQQEPRSGGGLGQIQGNHLYADARMSGMSGVSTLSSRMDLTRNVPANAMDDSLDLCLARKVDHHVLMFLGQALR